MIVNLAHQLFPVIGFIATLFPFCCSAGKVPSIAVVRPFSPKDANALPGSFGIWNDVPPTLKGSDTIVDLIVVCSQSPESSVAAASAIQETRDIFDASKGWNHSFSTMLDFDVGIDYDDDIYIAKERDTNPQWVNGPNRQFERILRRLQGVYDLVYIMEMDSVPIRPYWLDTLLYNIFSEKEAFAILGSKYRGHKWDAFIDELPWALVNHINGNAIYNLTHPVLWGLIEQLEHEATSVTNSVPYDYRIAQMIHEVNTGIVPTILGESTSIKLPPSTVATLAKFDLSNLVRETRVVGNYASTNMVPENFNEEEVIVHGALMRALWDSNKVGDISVVIRVWEDLHFDLFESMVDMLLNQVSEVVLVVSQDDTSRRNDELYQSLVKKGNVKVVVAQHEGTEINSSNLCAAKVGSPWFVVTDSYHQLSTATNRLEIMTAIEDDPPRPLVSFQESSFDSCYKFPSCVKEVELAKHIDPEFHKLFLTSDFVFHTATWNRFCDTLSTLVPRDNPTLGLYAGASSYMSFLKRKNKVHSLYALSDATCYGSNMEHFTPILESSAEVQALTTSDSTGDSSGDVFSTKKWSRILAPLETNSTTTGSTKSPKASTTKAPTVPATKVPYRKKKNIRKKVTRKKTAKRRAA